MRGFGQRGIGLNIEFAIDEPYASLFTVRYSNPLNGIGQTGIQ